MRILLPLLILSLSATQLSGQLWADSYAAARTEARASGKDLVVVFSGSDWCAPCIKLEREIWSDAEFQRLAPESFLFYRADFPRKKENRLPEDLSAVNGDLAERYNSRGAFPLVVVLTPDGELLGQAGYEKIEPAAYLRKLEAFTE